MSYEDMNTFKDNMEEYDEYKEYPYEVSYRLTMKNIKGVEPPVQTCRVYARNSREAREKVLLMVNYNRKGKRKYVVVSSKLLKHIITLSDNTIAQEEKANTEVTQNNG